MRPLRLSAGTWASVIAGIVLLIVPGAGGVAQASVPTVPIADDGRFITNLSAPALAPGSSGAVTLDVDNPLAQPMIQCMLIFGIYAFNAYPGNASGPVPTTGPQILGSNMAGIGGAYGPSHVYYNAPNVKSLGTLASGDVLRVSLPFVSSGSAPAGDYAVRLALTFQDGNGSAFDLASRGYFSDAVWAQATVGPNGTPTLDFGVLNVSGVIPETAILLRANLLPWVLYPILGGALVLAAAGGYYAFRGPRSRSGAKSPEEPIHAPRAFGKRRTSDGD